MFTTYAIQYYASLAQEFRTPLTVLLGMAESLRENPNPEAREVGQLVERNSRHLLRLVNQLLDLSKIESGALAPHPVHADVMRFVKATADFYTEEGGAPSPDLAPLGQKENELLARVRAFVDAHLEDDHYDLGQLCHDLAMSRMQLHRKLTALGAPSAALFIRAQRLARAQDLLKSTGLTVAEIAFRTGFADPAYFTRCFREAFGKSPSDWRKG